MRIESFGTSNSQTFKLSNFQTETMVYDKSHPNTDRIFLAGFMGSGKSVVGRILARKLRRGFADLDDILVREAGMSIPEIFRQTGEVAFRGMESRLAARYTRGKWVVALGGGTLLDPATKGLLMDSGTVVYLRAQAGTLAARLREETGNRPLLTGEGSLEERVSSLLKIREEAYSGAAWVVDTDDLTEDEVALLIFRKARASADD